MLQCWQFVFFELQDICEVLQCFELQQMERRRDIEVLAAVRNILSCDRQIERDIELCCHSLCCKG